MVANRNIAVAHAISGPGFMSNGLIVITTDLGSEVGSQTMSFLL